MYDNISKQIFKPTKHKNIMKILLKTILTLVLISFFSSADAEEKSAVLVDIKESNEPRHLTVEETVYYFMDAAKHFDSQYPGDKINQDFREDILKYFPDLTPQQVYDYQGYIRSGINIYRYVKHLIDKYKEARLTPKDPPLVAANDQYDLSAPETDYIESQDGNAVVIQDFKKIISYSQNPREIEAYRAKLASDGEKTGKLKDFEELGYILSKIDYKKILFYNIFYGSPLTGNRGIGDWDKKDDFKVRLITIQSGIVPDKSVEGAIHFFVPKDFFVTAVDSGLYFKPEISFEKSENLKDIKYTLPLPLSLRNTAEEWSVYKGEVAIPFKAEVTDYNSDLLLKADIKFNLCDDKLQCSAVEFSPELKLWTGHERDSSVATYIRMIDNFMVPEENSELKIISFGVEEATNGKQLLNIVFKAPEFIESFAAFLSNSDGLTFEQPRINIDGDIAVVKWLPTENKLIDKNALFEITADVNHKYILRQTQAPTDGKYLHQNNEYSLFVMGLIAVLCGILLNFMPPVLAMTMLKFYSLTDFGSKNSIKSYNRFLYTFLGIAVSFAAVLLIAVAQYLNWFDVIFGMQFLSPTLTILFLFVVLLLIAQEFKMFDLYNYLNTQSAFFQKTFCFIEGILIFGAAVLIPFPLSGTAFGFIFSGSLPQILCVWLCLFISFALPYVLVLKYPLLLSLWPVPGKWMEKYKAVVSTLLFVSLFGIALLIYPQFQSGFLWRAVCYLILFFLILRMRKDAYELDFENLDSLQRKQAVRFTVNTFSTLALIITVISSFDAEFSFKRNLVEQKKEYLASVDKDKIEELIKQEKTVLVKIESNWCLECLYNNVVVFNNPAVVKNMEKYNTETLSINWALAPKENTKFMKNINRQTLPLYVLFSPLVPNGLVLPQVLDELKFNLLMKNVSLTPVPADSNS